MTGHRPAAAGEVAAARRPLPGACVTAAAVVAAYVLQVGGVFAGGLIAHDLYDYASWILVGVLAVAGLALAASRGGVVRIGAASVGGVVAAQLVGTGLVAIRRWVPVGGFGHGGWDNVWQLRAVSLLLALSATGAAVACLWSLHRDRALPVQVPRRSRIVAVAAGVVMVCALPLVVAGGRSDVLDKTSIGAHALVYALPFGLSLALTGWLCRRSAVAVSAAVLLSGLVLAKPVRQLVSTPAHLSGLVLVSLLAGAVLVLRLTTAEDDAPAQAPSITS